MTVKVLVTAIGQQLVADVKQIENKDTNAIVGYWLKQPRTVNYQQGEDGSLGVNFGPYCPISDEAEFSIRAEHVVAILEPRNDVAEGYNQAVYPEGSTAPELETITEAEAFAQEAVEPKAQEGITPAPTTPEVNDATNTPSVEGPDNADSAVGTTGNGTEVPPA